MQTKEMKGITLVALVVTIVVLLILAGVSINLIIRDGGIFELTNKASKETSKASVKEKIQLEAIESIKYENLGIFDIDLFEDNLNKKLGIAEDKIIEEEENIIVRTDGYKITVNKDGQVDNIEDDDGIDNTKQPNTEYKNRTIEENYNAISGLTKKLFDYPFQYQAAFDTEDYKTAECGCGKYKEIFDKAVEMGLATTYTEADEIKEMGKDDSGKDVVKAEAMIVPIVEPSMVYYKFECKNEEQKPGGKIPMAFALNYGITFDGKKYFDSRKPNFYKPGGDFESAYAWLGQDWVDKGYTMLSARSIPLYPTIPISQLEQIYHFKIQVVTANNFRKAIRALNLDLRQYRGLCAHPIR